MKIAQHPRPARALLLGSIAALFLATPLARATVYFYTRTVSNTAATPTEWSAGTNWNGIPAGNAATILVFGNGTALAAGTTLFTDNNLGTAGVFGLNALRFQYAGPTSGTAPVLTITGNALEFVNNGAIAPTLLLAPTGPVKPVLVLNNDLHLTNDVTATVTTDATFGGAISGAAGLSFSGAGTVTLDNINNTFTGGLTIGSGTTVRYYNESNLGDASNVITLAGGTLATHVGSNYHLLNVVADSTIDTRFATNTGTQDTWMATLIGNATLTKTGRGLFVYGGDATGFTGNLVADGTANFTIGAATQFASPGAVFSGMTSANTITASHGALLNIVDGDNTTYVADRFGTAGNRPGVTLATGRLLWSSTGSGMQTETFGPLTIQPGASNVTTPILAGLTPQLTFSSLNRAVGGDLTIGGNGIFFTTAPTLVGGGGASGTTTVSIVPGVHTTSDFVTYGASGTRALTAAEHVSYTNNDFSTAVATNNARVTSTTAATMNAPVTVNSLLISAAAPLTFNAGLTVVSGQIMTISGTAPTITGHIAVNGDSLNLYTSGSLNATNWTLADNGSPVSLVRNGTGTITMTATADSTYTGGTYINEGTLTSSGTAHTLGNGPVYVSPAGTLNLANAGATGYAGSRSAPTYKVETGGLLTISTAAQSNEYFQTASGALFTVGSTAVAQSLDLQTNLNAAPGTILGESDTAPGAVLSLLSGGVPITTGLTTPTYYYGSPHTNITVGAGTPWLGVSSASRAATSLTLSITANSDFTILGTNTSLQAGSFNIPTLTLTGANIATPNGNVNVNIQNTVALTGSTNTFGSAGNRVTLVLQAGAALQTSIDNSLGASGLPANVVIQTGGYFAVTGSGSTPTAAVNGNVLIQPGGLISFTNAPRGTGVMTHTNGSTLSLSGSNTDVASNATQSFGTVPGTLVRLVVPNLSPGSSTGGVTKLDASFNDAANYEWQANGSQFGNAASATDSLLTLSASNGLGGILTGVAGPANVTLAPAIGVIRIGSGGGTFAAANGGTFFMEQTFDLGANTLKIGTPLSIYGTPRLGIVALAVPTLSTPAPTAVLGSVISVTSGATLRLWNVNYEQIPDVTRVNVSAGATFDLGGVTETIESLSGGGTVTGSLGGAVLILATSTNNADFSGTIGGPSFNSISYVRKIGSGTQTFSGTNTYSGPVYVNEGTLKVNGSLFGNVFAAGGRVSGNGQLGFVEIQSGGTMAPGDGIGTLSVGPLWMDDSTTTFQLEVKLDGTPRADLLNTSEISLGGGPLNVSLQNFNPNQLPQTFLFVNNLFGDPVSGTFGSITGLPAGVTATIDYAYSGVDSLGRVGDGNDIALILTIPEPTSAGLLLAAGLPLLGRRRRRGNGLATGEDRT